MNSLQNFILDYWQNGFFSSTLLSASFSSILAGIIIFFSKKAIDLKVSKRLIEFQNDMQIKGKALEEKIKNDYILEQEKFKVSLKKSEFIFQKEYEAGVEFIKIIKEYELPYDPELPSNTYFDQFGKYSENILSKLKEFYLNYAVILSHEDRKNLENTISKITIEQWDINKEELGEYIYYFHKEFKNKLIYNIQTSSTTEIQNK